MTKERLCLFCTKLDQEYQRMGSEWTGAYGEDGFTCTAGHFNEFHCNSIENMRVIFLRANTCPHYDQPLDNRSEPSA